MYVLTHTTYLGTEELKCEQVGKYHGMNRDWNVDQV